MKKTIILKNRNTGLLINFDPKEIDLTELSIDTVGTNVFIVYGDYEVIQAKSKKDAETSIEEIKKEISQLIIDNEEEALAEDADKNPNINKVMNVLGKLADLISPLLNNEPLFEFLSEYIEDYVSDGIESLIQRSVEESTEERTEIQDATEEPEPVPEKIPLVTLEKPEETEEQEKQQEQKTIVLDI